MIERRTGFLNHRGFGYSGYFGCEINRLTVFSRRPGGTYWVTRHVNIQHRSNCRLTLLPHQGFWRRLLWVQEGRADKLPVRQLRVGVLGKVHGKNGVRVLLAILPVQIGTGVERGAFKLRFHAKHLHWDLHVDPLDVLSVSHSSYAIESYQSFTCALLSTENYHDQKVLDMSSITGTTSTTGAPAPAPKDAKLWKAAQSLEANFLAEMLKSAGLGESREGFGGGIGEDQFSSFLVREYSEATVAAGGIGLAESIYRSLADQNASEGR